MQRPSGQRTSGAYTLFNSSVDKRFVAFSVNGVDNLKGKGWAPNPLDVVHACPSGPREGRAGNHVLHPKGGKSLALRYACSLSSTQRQAAAAV